MNKVALNSALVGLMTATAARAEPVFIGEAGGWDVVRAETRCFASATFEGPGQTVLTIAKEVSGDLATLLTNQNWTVEPGRKYHTVFIVDGEEFTGGDSIGSEHGLFDTFDPDFEQSFRSGHALIIKLDGTEIARLSLKGSADAMAKVNACQRQLFAALSKEERDAIRFRDLPVNPFATAAAAVAPGGSAVRNPHGPQPLEQGSWAARIQENYPAIAIRNEWEGAVGIRVDVGVDGRASSCSVSSSSGHPELDQAACEGALRYARFVPAADEAGKAVSGSFSTRVVYSLSP